jgi:hypothetical protein
MKLRMDGAHEPGACPSIIVKIYFSSYKKRDRIRLYILS